MIIFFAVDINECGGANDCHANATCTDTVTSYVCTCKDGFSGDGKDCTGDRIAQFKTFNVLFH